MDLRILEYFLMVAEVGNITRASELMHVFQPTVSRQLMELEDELGKKLLNRSHKNLTLTEEGQLFRETAREILALYRKAKQNSAGLAGDIYLGTGETGSFTHLAAQIKRFQEVNPAVKFHVISENADRIGEDIDKGLLDLGFVHRRVNPAKYETLKLPAREQWGILVPEGHPLARKTALIPADLAGERLLMPENAQFQGELLRWLGPDAERSVAATCNLLHNAIIMAQAGIALAICFGGDEARRDGLVFIPFAGLEPAPALLIWKHKPILPTAVEQFLKFLNNSDSE